MRRCAPSRGAVLQRLEVPPARSEVARQPGQLRADFEAYLDGFSPNVGEILDKLRIPQPDPRLSKADALGTLIEKFLDPSINLSPIRVERRRLGEGPRAGQPRHGTLFEELVRRFNEENNEEAGEHWTPRDVVRLMANLVFLPIADRIASGTYLLYDAPWARAAC